MGGISANKPILPLITGPMLPGSLQGKRLGACTDCRSNWATYRAGGLDIEDIRAVNEELAPTVSLHQLPGGMSVALIKMKAGTCGVMGTASTMACITAALGMMPLSGASAPAVSSMRLRVAEETGSNAVKVVASKGFLAPQSLLTRESFLNAIVVLQAIGGSTNAIVHLMAIINRHPLLADSITLHTINEIGQNVPLLVDLKPSGDNFMNDFHNAGGMAALLLTLRPLLYLNAMTITGQTLGEVLDALPASTAAFAYSKQIIRPLSDPLYPASSLVVVRGNLAPNGAIIKASASKYRHLLRHSGPAVVFRNTQDLASRIDDPGLPVTKDSVLVLQGIGPVGNPGMPEAGVIPIPQKLAANGIKDMLRISDGRMSGTAGGTILLHVSPESAILDSTFGIVRDGDMIHFDCGKMSINLDLSDEEIQHRLNSRQASSSEQQVSRRRQTMRGYRGLYERCVNQAQDGADFDFLTASGPCRASDCRKCVKYL